MTLKMLGLSKGCLGAATAAFLALGALPVLGAGGADDLIVRLRLSGETAPLRPSAPASWKSCPSSRM